MAGSYKHVTTTGSGALRSNESFAGMIENLGDAYEAVTEMYGMIWYLAQNLADPAGAVEHAREHYREGIELSPGVQT